MHHAGKLGQQNRTVKRKLQKMQISAKLPMIRRQKLQICQASVSNFAHFPAQV
jgi:hypothetical protein